MAKDLPWFKWSPSKWDSGNIQMCSQASKGTFADLCSLYWTRLGELPYALAMQKLCKADAHALQELYEHQIFSVADGQVRIDFLDEQLSEFDQASEKRRKAANKRWSDQKKTPDASALQVHMQSNAIKSREEENRTDKNRKDKKEAPAIAVPFTGEVLNSWNEWIEYRRERKLKNTESSVKKQIQFLGGRADPEIIEIINSSIRNGYQGLFELKNNGTSTKTTRTTGQGTPQAGATRKRFTWDG